MPTALPNQAKIATLKHTMNTPLLQANQLSQAVRLLQESQVVALPSETVYGLAGLATSDQAVASIFRIKGRASDNPLISHFAHLDQLSNYAISPCPLAKELFNAFSPGPLTLILPSSSGISSLALAGQSSIAVRIPCHPLFQQILKQIDRPLVAPSANLSGRYSATSAAMVYAQLSGKIPAIVDGGACALGLESTVVLVQEGLATILRHGSITAEQIADLLGKHRLTLAPNLQVTGATSVLSPGTKYAHYQPQKPLHLFSNPANLTKASSASAAVLALSNLGLKPDLQTILFSDAAAYARGLYASLAAADEGDAKEIFAYYHVSLGDALCDRLYRAANGKFL
jgi:L-threonylcarbamoyladenylate synthase